MKRNPRFLGKAPCVLCAVALAAAAALAPAQDKSHDTLAQAREKATAENQRILLLLAGEDDSLVRTLSGRALGRLIRYEYQLAAVPADSLAGRRLREKLSLGDAIPCLVAMTTGGKVLGTMKEEQIATDDSASAITKFLQEHKCAPVDAKAVLADGILEARKTKRHVFVYLSAPW